MFTELKPTDRLYIVDDVVLLYIPPGVDVFKDENGRLFIDRNDVRDWKRLRDFLGAMLSESPSDDNS